MFRILVKNYAYTRWSVKIGGSRNGTAAQLFWGDRAASGQHGTFHNKFS